MIHLDTNLLIAMVKINDAHHATASRLATGSDTLFASSIAWMEFSSRPVQPAIAMALQGMLRGGIIPFDENSASLAGELFHLTGSKRRTRIDTMIAATAILTGAQLATANPQDFTPFLPHGLKLYPL